MAVDGYMVNGAALVYTGTGSSSALELLGYTEAGVDQDIFENKSEIMTDLFGPMTPQDFQDMGMMARIVVPLIACDRTVLAKIMGKSDRTAIGQIGTPGLVLGVGGYAFRVAIAAPADSPWSFSKCIVRAEGTRLATKANVFRVEFLAWPYASYTATTGKDAPLWTRSIV